MKIWNVYIIPHFQNRFISLPACSQTIRRVAAIIYLLPSRNSTVLRLLSGLGVADTCQQQSQRMPSLSM